METVTWMRRLPRPQGAQDKIAVLEAQRPALAATHAAALADIEADRVTLQTKASQQITDVEGKELEKRLANEQKFTDLQEEVRSKHTEFIFRELDKIAQENERLDEKAARETQRQLDQQERAYEAFSERVVDFTRERLRGLVAGHTERGRILQGPPHQAAQ